MNATSSAVSRPPISPNLSHAFGGVWRLTVRRCLLPGHWLIVAGLVALLALVTTATVHQPRVSERFFTWTSGFYLSFLIPLFAFVSAGGTLRDELKPGSVDYIFTRPIPRSAFVVFKFIAHLACVQLDFLVALAALAAVGVYRGVPGILAAMPLLFLGQFLALLAFSAFGFLCGIFTSRYVIVGLIYGAVIEVGLGQIPTALNQLAMTHQVKLIVKPLLTMTTLVDGLPAGQSELMGAAVLAIFSTVALGVAALIFSSRELAGASSRDT